MKLTAVFLQVPEGGYVAFIEELPGANTQGATLDEARENLREAVALVIEANRELARRIVARTERHTRTVRASLVKRRDLIRHPKSQDFRLLREGGRHSVFVNPTTNATSAVPRHNEIHEYLARKICRDLQVPQM